MSQTVSLRNAEGRSVDLLLLHHRGKSHWGPDNIETLVADPDTGTVQLLEETEYEFTFGGVDVDDIQPSEIFDLSNGRAGGRVRPGGRTGLVCIDLFDTAGDCYSGEVEVRSRKLDYKTEYRWMLDRIASEATELALAPFAASRLGSLGAEHTQTSETLYQRFEFLQARINSEEFASAVEQLRHRPHTSFEEHREITTISRPMPGGRSLAQQLTKPGPRVRLQTPVGPLTTLPQTLHRVTFEESLDTIPNRFVRYVVEDWLQLVDRVEKALVESSTGTGSRRTLPTVSRAQQQLGMARAQLEDIGRIPAVREAGRLEQFPASNPVVRSRAGYREFLAAFQATNALAHLRWDQDEATMSAGQHDVPTLYEYWVFLEIARLVGTLSGFEVKKQSLISASKDGLSLRLRKANEVVVEATGEHRGVRVELELWFNRSFSYSKNAAVESDGSWTVQMRPDVSLSISPEGIAPAEKTWVHFDAKYKVRQYSDGFEDQDKEVDKHAVPADVQKMHAYRDAIRRSAGAYVVYPGNKELERQQYHELLPGLGAFALRPRSDGNADPESARGLRNFILDVIDHLTSQGTAYQRDRYWRLQSQAEPGYRAKPRPFLDMPPADTPVLLGYLRSAEHAAAVRALGLYNLRADLDRAGAVGLHSAEVGAKLLVLYGQGAPMVYRAAVDSGGATEVVIRRSTDLAIGGYVPSGDLYLCLPFEAEPVMQLEEAVVRSIAGQPGHSGGAPVSTTWAEIERLM